MRSRYEKQAHKELQAEGYIVDYKIRPRFPMRDYNVDFLGAFDLIAFKPGEPFIRWISIKGVNSGSRYKNIEEILALRLPPGNRKEQWWIKKKVWQKDIIGDSQDLDLLDAPPATS